MSVAIGKRFGVGGDKFMLNNVFKLDSKRVYA